MPKKSATQDTTEPQGESLAPGAEATQAAASDAAAGDTAASVGGDVTPPEDTAAIAALMATPVFAAAIENAVKAYIDLAIFPAIEQGVKAYLDANLEELVKAAMPPTPEQQAQRERESFEETVRREQAAAARRAKREAAEAEKLATAAADAQAKRDAEAAKAFEAATAFVGTIADLNAKIVREIRIDDGMAYSAELRFPVEFGEFEATNDGGLLLTKAIDLPRGGREFAVRGVSLITDAGVLRIETLGSRASGNGKAVHFPPKSLVFYPAAPDRDAA